MKHKKGGLPPVSDLDADYLQWHASRNIRDSFWAPTNNHNCLLNSFTAKEKFFLRDYERYPVSSAGISKKPPYPNEHHADYYAWMEDRKSQMRSASLKHRASLAAAREAEKENAPSGPTTTALTHNDATLASTAADSHAAPTLHPSDTVELDVGLKTKHQIQEEGKEARRVSVDVVSGKLLSHREARELIKGGEAWRLARVVTHTTPQDYEGTRPHTATYAHYKYHGFAGHGAKTSYAHRDGLSSMTRDKPFKRTVQVTASTAAIRKSKAERRDMESAVKTVEADLITGKSVSDLTVTLQESKRQQPGHKEGQTVTTQTLEGERPEDILLEAWRRVKVTTHKAPKRYEGTRPYSQTYGHYKYQGYAGMGAKTSWAKNPRMDALKLLEADNEF